MHKSMGSSSQSFFVPVSISFLLWQGWGECKGCDFVVFCVHELLGWNWRDVNSSKTRNWRDFLHLGSLGKLLISWLMDIGSRRHVWRSHSFRFTFCKLKDRVCHSWHQVEQKLMPRVYLKTDWMLPELAMAEDLQQKDFSLTCLCTNRPIRHIPSIQWKSQTYPDISTPLQIITAEFIERLQ